MTLAAVTTLLAGIAIGFVAQRSRMCFVAGIRDFIFIRDTFLLKGLLVFAAVAWLGFSLTDLFSVTPATQPVSMNADVLVQIVVSGFGLGFLSTLADGCPLRQHVLAGQGNLAAWFYLLGFFVGIVVFYQWVLPFMLRF